MFIKICLLHEHALPVQVGEHLLLTVMPKLHNRFILMNIK